jgi:hypothetical protein
MSHLTAGDISPLYTKNETTYGTPDAGDPAYYADIKGDGGSFTPTDNQNPYVAWRNDSRAYNIHDYVQTFGEAGYTDVLEVRDRAGWEVILNNAMGNTTTLGTPRLPSRTTTLLAKAGSTYNTLVYNGCKTDRLEIKADQPGGVVEFSETVLASNSRSAGTGTRPSYDPPAALTSFPAVQWVGGVQANNTTIYPQNFRISINNNLGRVKGWIESVGRAATTDLIEGHLDMELSFDVWMEDLQFMRDNATAGNMKYSTLIFTLGSIQPVHLALYGSLMYDGQLPSLVQDKQMETIRYRIEQMYYTIPE